MTILEPLLKTFIVRGYPTRPLFRRARDSALPLSIPLWSYSDRPSKRAKRSSTEDKFCLSV